MLAFQSVLFILDPQFIDPKLLRRPESLLDELSILLEFVLGFFQFFVGQLDLAVLFVDISLVFSGNRAVIESDVGQTAP